MKIRDLLSTKPKSHIGGIKVVLPKSTKDDWISTNLIPANSTGPIILEDVWIAERNKLVDLIGFYYHVINDTTNFLFVAILEKSRFLDLMIIE